MRGSPLTYSIGTSTVVLGRFSGAGLPMSPISVSSYGSSSRAGAELGAVAVLLRVQLLDHTQGDHKAHLSDANDLGPFDAAREPDSRPVPIVS
jgi:hypothetical protein